MERRPTILIAPRYYDPGNGFREALQKSGYHTVSLSSHPEIFDFLAQKQVDMAIVGIATTVEFCETIMRQVKKMNLQIPVIVVSSFKDIQGKDKLGDLGVKEWMVQPFDMEYLKRRIKELLGV